MMKGIDKHYVSEIDKKMADFNTTHPLSAEQKAESDKYKHLYQLRDNSSVVAHTDKEDLWK